MRVIPIDPERLDKMRANAADDLGNPWTEHTAEGWEPLRCCLRKAPAGEAIALISYRPDETMSTWTEIGPVFVHGARCEGYDDPSGFPQAFATGARLLRPYLPDGGINYDRIRIVQDNADAERSLAELLAQPDVDHVHVRSLFAQCFHFVVRG